MTALSVIGEESEHRVGLGGFINRHGNISIIFVI
jgi:hypothetical protein